jgi:transcriptional regulator with XRE-family HTH domain
MTKDEITTVRRQELGDELKALREASGLSVQKSAKRVHISASKLSRIENGLRPASVEDVVGLLTLYEADAAKRKQLRALAYEPDARGWWQRDRPNFTERLHTLIFLEGRADHIVNFATLVMPGLLQTGEYTRAVMTESGLVPADDIENRMVTRLRRHSVLLRQRPPHLTAIIDESVLHRPVGGRDILRRQLEHMMEASARSNITIRIVPNQGAHAGIAGSFQLITQPERPTVVFVEHAASCLFIEDRHEVKVYRDIAKKLLDTALDEGQSREVITDLAKRLDTEASSAWDSPNSAH